MNLKHTITMDLTGQNTLTRVDAVQGDRYVRQLEFALYQGSEPWQIPEDAHPVIRFQRGDGTGGEYDAAPDGTPAWAVRANLLTIVLAPQVLSCPGLTKLAVDLLCGEKRLSTFDVVLLVHDTIPRDLEQIANFPVGGFLTTPDTAQIGQFLRVKSVNDYGTVSALEAYSLPSLEDAVALALKTAKESGEFDGASAYEVALENGFEGTEAEWLESLEGEDCRFADTSKLGDIQQINITGTLTSDSGAVINFKKSRIQGVKAPAADTDAANKAYVDQVCADYTVPAAWKSAVQTAVETVLAHQNAGGRSCVSFAWFSDSHIAEGETSVVGDLAAAVMDKCAIPFAVFCGDAADISGDTETSMRAGLAAAAEALSPIGSNRLLLAQGSQDGTWSTGQLDTKTMFGLLFRRQAEDVRRVFGGDGSYYYLDYPAAKVRFVVLNSAWTADELDESGAPLHPRRENSGFGNAQLNWLAETALSFQEDGWTLILAAHMPPNSESVRDGGVLCGILNAFSEKTAYAGSFGTAGDWDYVSVSCSYANAAAADIAGFFCGGVHMDTVAADETDFTIVTITSDADQSADETEAVRIPGSNNAHALDFVTVNLAEKAVYLTRLGIGSNRSYAY